MRPQNLTPRVLVACESSGTVRRAFRARGFDAWSADLLPADDGSPYHVQGDATALLVPGEWDLLIAHPPCTRLANSGVRWLAERNLWQDLDSAVALFVTFMRAPVPSVAVENPIQHKHARRRIAAMLGVSEEDARPTQIIQPWQHGHGEQKATGLWLRGLPELAPSNVVDGREQRVWKMPPSPDRWKARSKTFEGIAEAMAHQWSQVAWRNFAARYKV